jgi:hypothetical protein
MEQQIRDYLATRSGPLRVERLAPRVLGKEWRDLSPADKERIIREFRRCGFVQHAFPFWVRAKPRIALTESSFAELVEYANRFTDANGRAPSGLRELATHLRDDADPATVQGLFGLADDPAFEAALACATFVRAAA